VIYRILTFAALLATWVVFSGLFDPFHLTLGVISCAWVTWMSSDLLFTNRRQTLAERLRQAALLPGYTIWLAWEIVKANWHVLKLALHPHGLREVEPEIVRFTTGLRSEFAKWLLANSITLTPGTVTVKITGNEFVVHAISRQSTTGLGTVMERRIAHIFEPQSAAGPAATKSSSSSST
jgi:multicomponent Na+:H+ antiporter subunit E